MTHAFLQREYNTIKPHGSEFKKKIKEINNILNLDIKIQHNFLNWFRCNGKCSRIASHFYGYVSTNDENRMFDQKRPEVINHNQLCGGQFQKIDEPGADVLLKLRYVKRNRKALLEEEREDQLEVESCKSCKCNEKLTGKSSTSTQSFVKAVKMTRYSTDEEE